MRWLERLASPQPAAKSCWAVDVGSSGVRAVLLKRRGRRVRLINWKEVTWERDLPGPPAPEQVSRALAELTGGRKISSEIVAAAVPIHQVFVKSLVVPFTRSFQIRQVIASEAELHIPYPLEEVVFDFWPLEELEGGKTRVMTMAVRKELLAGHIELLQGAGINPSVVGVDFLGSAAALAQAEAIDEAEAIILVEVGTSHTAVAFFLEGRIKFMRSFIWGGDTISQALMKEFGCSFAEAERIKASALVGPAEERVLAGLGPALEEMGGELTRTIYAASSQSFGPPPSRLILADTAGIPGLKEFLASRTGLEVSVPQLLKGVAVKKSKLSFPFSAWSCLGLALNQLHPGGQRVNFRSGEFSLKGAGGAVRRRLWLAGVEAAALAAVLLVFLLGRIKAEEKKSLELQNKIQAILQQTSTPAAQIISGLEHIQMEEKLKQAQRDIKEYRRLETISALEILREMSRLVPAEIPIQVVELDITPDRVRLKGRTNNYGSVEAVREALSRSPYFQGEIDPGGMRTRRRGGELVTVEFDYLIPVHPPEI